MSITMRQFAPQASVTVHTWRGDTFDVTGDLYGWSTQKSMTSGTFNLQLVPRKPWARLIQPMDYVEIRASRSPTRGELPIIMRGFVDSPSKSTQMPAQGGPSEPRIVITGEDYTKILTKWQILYLFTQNTFLPTSADPRLAHNLAQGAGFGMFANFNIPIFSKTVNDFATSVFNNIVSPAVFNLKQHNYPTFTDLAHDFTFPDYPMNGLNVASYTGSFWNLLDYVASPPFGELFVRDDADSPVLVGRGTPYKTITGATPKGGHMIPNSGDITDIQSINVAQSDSDVYTYFLTWAADGQLLQMTMPTFLPGLSNGVLTQKSTLYGTNPLMIDTPWCSVSSPNVLQEAANLNEWLIATMGDNELFHSGSITCHGDEKYQVGTYRTARDTNQEFYISGVGNNFQYAGNRWDATLQVVRGRDLG